MKRLLAYLFIVLGLGLTFNVNVNAKAKGKHLCFIDWPSNIDYGNYQSLKIPVDKVVFIKRLKYDDGSSCHLKIFASDNEKLYKKIIWSAFQDRKLYEVDGKKMSLRWLPYKTLHKIHKDQNLKMVKFNIGKPKTQIAKAEPSQTQKVASSTNSSHKFKGIICAKEAWDWSGSKGKFTGKYEDVFIFSDRNKSCEDIDYTMINLDYNKYLNILKNPELYSDRNKKLKYTIKNNKICINKKSFLINNLSNSCSKNETEVFVTAGNGNKINLISNRKTQIAKAEPSQTEKVAKKETKKTSSKKKNSSNKLPICMNPVAGAKSWYFIKEDGHCYKTLEVKLTNENSLYNTYYNNIYNKKVYEGKIKTAKKKNDSSLLDKLKKGSQEIINNISSDSKKKKIVKKNKPKIKLKTKKIKVIEEPKSPFEKKVLAALELEKNNKVKCVIVEKSNLLSGAKANFCIKKSDIIKLGEYKKFEKFPKNMVATIKGCKSNHCIRKTAGKNVYKLFVQKKERYHTKHPGDIIYGMAWFEVLYLDKLKKAQSAINRYSSNQYDGLMKLKKGDHEKLIYSLIKMNNGRIKMRNALGLSLYDDLELVLKNHWLLGDFLNNDKLKVEKVALDPQLKKRKLLLDKYKTTLSKYKKKLEEKKNNS